MQDRNKQIEFIIGIPYQSDIKKVTTAIHGTLTKNEKVMKSPAAAIVVQQLGEWAIDLKISFWVDDLTEAGSIRSDAMIQIYEMLIANGVRLPVHRGPAAEPPIPKTPIPWKLVEDNV
jgi:small-conductance mechanosensitive channel